MPPITSQASLADRIELVELVSRLGRWLDDPASADPADLLADDASAVTPGGAVEGRERVVAQARRNHDGHVTQHVMTDVLSDVDGDAAQLTANLLVAFIDPEAAQAPTWQSGSRYRFGATRTARGWRLASIAVTPIWQIGERPAIPATALPSS